MPKLILSNVPVVAILMAVWRKTVIIIQMSPLLHYGSVRVAVSSGNCQKMLGWWSSSERRANEHNRFS